MVSITTTVFVEKGHGRLVCYTLQTITACNAYLEQELAWSKVGQILALERHVTYLKSGQASTTIHYALTNLSPQQADPATLFHLWHHHWHVENKLHWLRDVLFAEDISQARTGSLPLTLSLLRNAVISLLKLYGYQQVTEARTYFACHPQLACSFVGFPLE